MVSYSWLREDVLGGGNIIASWPALALTIGALVTCPSRPLLRWSAVALTVGAYAIGGLRMLEPTIQRPDAAAAVAYIESRSSPGDPIVSTSLFANPLSELDVALATAGQSTRNPVLRLGSPPLSLQLKYLADPHPAIILGLPVTPLGEVAHQAAALAHNGRVFFFAPQWLSPGYLKKDPNSFEAVFFRALPGGYHVVGHATFPGFDGLLPEAVTELSNRSGSTGR
jgi:hypothetical protein